MAECDIRIAPYHTTWGEAWVAFHNDSIVELGLPGTAAPHLFGDASPAVGETIAALERYWAGGALPRAAADVLDAAAVTPLRGAIYREVANIAHGSTLTYTEIAARVGRRGAARAVGAAMAGNRFAPIIPCHRVVGSDGSLRGYAGGIEMKRYLLDMERAAGAKNG